jgi:hypothetical protein
MSTQVFGTQDSTGQNSSASSKSTASSTILVRPSTVFTSVVTCQCSAHSASRVMSACPASSSERSRTSVSGTTCLFLVSSSTSVPTHCAEVVRRCIARRRGSVVYDQRTSGFVTLPLNNNNRPYCNKSASVIHRINYISTQATATFVSALTFRSILTRL